MSLAFQLALLVQTPGIVFIKNKIKIPCSLPFLLYTLILFIVVHALNTCSSYTTRLGSFFEGFCLDFVMFLAKVMIKKI
jgi:hypothetical protein